MRPARQGGTSSLGPMRNDQRSNEGGNLPDMGKKDNAKGMGNQNQTPVTQNMSLSREIIFVATICTAQLYARKSTSRMDWT